MKKKSIAKNYLYNLSYQMIILIIPLFTIPYLTRVLGATKLGIYSYTFSIVTIFFLLSILGGNTYGQREIAYVQDDRKKRTQIFWELMIIKILSSTLSTILLLIFSFITPRYEIYYQIFMLYVFSNMFDITWLYQGIEDFKDVSIRNLIVKLLYFVSIFIFVKGKYSLEIYILLFSLSTLLTNLSFWINVNKIIDKPEKKSLNIKRHIKYIISFFIPQIASLIYTVLDKTMIGIIMPNIDNVSFYEQSSYIVKTILMLITTIGTVMVTRMSYSFEKKDYKKMKEYMNNVINFVWLSGSALMFGIAAVIKNLVPWFYGHEFLPIIELVYYLCPLIIVIGLNSIIGIQYLIPIKKQNKYIFSVVCGAVINFLLNLILINLIGTKGAAISSVFAETSILIIEMRYVKDIITYKDLLKPSLKYLPFGFLMFIFVYLIGNLLKPTILSTFIQIIIGIVIYFCLLFISKDKFILNLMKKRKNM